MGTNQVLHRLQHLYQVIVTTTIFSLLETGEPTVKTIISINVSNPNRDPNYYALNNFPDDGYLLGFETLTEIMVFTVGSSVSNKEDINHRSLKSTTILFHVHLRMAYNSSYVTHV